MVCNGSDIVIIINHEMESLEEIPELDLKISLKTKTEVKCENFPEESCEERSEQESECKNNTDEAFEFCWQDFVPVSLSSSFLSSRPNIPSLLSLVSDASDLLPDGALFFNFCFDWWFTEPLHPDEDSVKVVELKFPCTRCERKFQFDWQVSQHYLEVHQACPVDKVKQEETKPPPQQTQTKEPTPEPEVYVEPYPLFIDWRWEDFLPDWDEPFLPYGDLIDFQESDIEDDCPTPPPASPSPSPPPPSPPSPPPPPAPPVLAIPPVLDKRPQPILAPVIKQTKFLCRTCDKIICNSCFSKRCGVHNVEFKGTATFACSLC